MEDLLKGDRDALTLKMLGYNVSQTGSVYNVITPDKLKYCAFTISGEMIEDFTDKNDYGTSSTDLGDVTYFVDYDSDLYAVISNITGEILVKLESEYRKLRVTAIPGSYNLNGLYFRVVYGEYMHLIITDENATDNKVRVIQLEYERCTVDICDINKSVSPYNGITSIIVRYHKSAYDSEDKALIINIKGKEIQWNVHKLNAKSNIPSAWKLMK